MIPIFQQRFEETNIDQNSARKYALLFILLANKT